jgi:hypothetical protein
MAEPYRLHGGLDLVVVRAPAVAFHVIRWLTGYRFLTRRCGKLADPHFPLPF